VLAGIGLIKNFNSNTSIRADIIPVDMVSNAIIVGTAYQANKNSLLLMHSNSSHANPTTWQKYAEYFTEYLKSQPFD
jgi:hypothetical protein